MDEEIKQHLRGASTRLRRRIAKNFSDGLYTNKEHKLADHLREAGLQDLAARILACKQCGTERSQDEIDNFMVALCTDCVSKEYEMNSVQVDLLDTVAQLIADAPEGNPLHGSVVDRVSSDVLSYITISLKDSSVWTLKLDYLGKDDGASS